VVQTAERQDVSTPGRGYRLIDCDVHPVFPGEWADDLGPYMTEEWRMRLQGRVTAGRSKTKRELPSGRYMMPGNQFFPIPGGNLRLDLIH